MCAFICVDRPTCEKNKSRELWAHKEKKNTHLSFLKQESGQATPLSERKKKKRLAERWVLMKEKQINKYIYITCKGSAKIWVVLVRDRTRFVNLSAIILPLFVLQSILWTTSVAYLAASSRWQGSNAPRFFFWGGGMGTHTHKKKTNGKENKRKSEVSCSVCPMDLWREPNSPSPVTSKEKKKEKERKKK